MPAVFQENSVGPVKGGDWTSQGRFLSLAQQPL